MTGIGTARTSTGVVRKRVPFGHLIGTVLAAAAGGRITQQQNRSKTARMVDARALDAEIEALDYSHLKVGPEHIDANGHMNVGYYGVLFDRALDLPWARLGIYSEPIIAAGKSSFALESHLTFQRELRAGDPLAFSLLLLDYDAKRVHYFMRMFHARERWLAATCEQLSICMDMATRRSTDWPPACVANISALFEVHCTRRRPTEAGRTLGIRRRSV
jgi:acyl-CoA thioester hydrolase